LFLFYEIVRTFLKVNHSKDCIHFGFKSDLNQTDEFHQPSPEQADLLLDVGDVLLVDLLQRLERVARVSACMKRKLF
jgi:hypothetical protein